MCADQDGWSCYKPGVFPTVLAHEQLVRSNPLMLAILRPDIRGWWITDKLPLKTQPSGTASWRSRNMPWDVRKQKQTALLQDHIYPSFECPGGSSVRQVLQTATCTLRWSLRLTDKYADTAVGGDALVEGALDLVRVFPRLIEGRARIVRADHGAALGLFALAPFTFDFRGVVDRHETVRALVRVAGWVFRDITWSPEGRVYRRDLFGVVKRFSIVLKTSVGRWR